MTSEAYRLFLDNLKIAESLLKLEQKYPDPPPSKHKMTVEGLRGGTIVLMVAAFESYMHALFTEYLDVLTTAPLTFKPEKLPDKTRRISIERKVDLIKTIKEENRLAEYIAMANIISSNALFTESFTTYTRSNPNPENIKKLFNGLGFADFFGKIQSDFNIKWGSAVSIVIVKDKLQEIINYRNSVAHNANSLNVSRIQLQEWLKFFKIFGKICDNTLASHVRSIAGVAKRRRK